MEISRSFSREITKPIVLLIRSLYISYRIKGILWLQIDDLWGRPGTAGFAVGPQRALVSRGFSVFFRSDAMLKPFQIRVAVVLLAGFTLAAAVLASLNFAKEGSFSLPTDQVSWVEAPGGLKAQRVLKDGPGERAGIKAGDLLDCGQQRPHSTHVVPDPAMVCRGHLSAAWTTCWFGRAFPSTHRSFLSPPTAAEYQGLRLIALVYLSIGLYVLFRRWTAPRATHFYVFCLASFVLYSFNYTGKFNTFDWTIYWGKIVAGALQPALFLHFALAFPEERPASRRHWINSLIYLPGLAVIGLQVVAQWRWEATELLNTRLDQLAMGYLALYYVLAALVFFRNYLRQTEPASPPAVEVADPGNFAHRHSLHGAGCHPFSHRHSGSRCSGQAGGNLPGLFAADL